MGAGTRVEEGSHAQERTVGNFSDKRMCNQQFGRMGRKHSIIWLELVPYYNFFKCLKSILKILRWTERQIVSKNFSLKSGQIHLYLENFLKT